MAQSHKDSHHIRRKLRPSKWKFTDYKSRHLSSSCCSLQPWASSFVTWTFSFLICKLGPPFLAFPPLRIVLRTKCPCPASVKSVVKHKGTASVGEDGGRCGCPNKSVLTSHWRERKKGHGRCRIGWRARVASRCLTVAPSWVKQQTADLKSLFLGLCDTEMQPESSEPLLLPHSPNPGCL